MYLLLLHYIILYERYINCMLYLKK
uniref:Uncharacterized protein n=1 Tax=Anguilla anguilla TaxID=7936 RepID=A0A0E9TXY4_ANGAN